MMQPDSDVKMLKSGDVVVIEQTSGREVRQEISRKDAKERQKPEELEFTTEQTSPHLPL
jgi:hypothetical protein